MTQSPGLTRRVMVVDTQALWYFLTQPSRLSRRASLAFESASTGEAVIVVPAIVVAELYFLAVKAREPVEPSKIIDHIDAIPGLMITDLNREQLELLSALTDIPEMHDRLIAAEAVLLDAPVITRDGEILAAAGVEYVW